jgi:Holliday junction resolvasome RuvABC endonuclease subunit
MRIVGIDPGTACGWAIIDNGKRIASGVWDLRGRRHEGGGMRYLRARKYFEDVVDSTKIDAVAYEEVRRHQGVDAAHIYGGIIGQITAICEEKSIPFKGIPVGTAKKVATGRGNASKDDMISAANTKWDLSIDNDNEADALWMAQTLHNELTT